MPTIYVSHPRFTEHRMDDYAHPEHPGRITAAWDMLDTAQLPERMQRPIPERVSEDLIRLAHSEKYLELMQWIAKQETPVLIDADTYARPESYDIARLAAGAVVKTVDAILDGTVTNGLAAVRPPGHHATPQRPMGFCLLGNIAISAYHALENYKLNRIMIVDYDVHHGNGTQDIFYDDDRVLFISTHQHPYYPGTGSFNQTGSGKGDGYTINVPLPVGQGDKNFAAIFDQLIWTAARRFEPELILVSAGFDAHWKDPLAMMELSLQGYDHLNRELMKMADELCGGKIAFVMEGGYDLTVIGNGIRNIAHALLGDTEISDPLGLSDQPEPDVQPLIEHIKTLHAL